MQRRAAAVSVAFFLVIAAGAYALIGAAQQPTVSIEDANVDHEISDVNETLVVGGIEYNVTEIGSTSATATWTNESARFTATLQNNSTVAYRGGNYTVLVPNTSSPEQFRLREVQSVEHPTVTRNGTTYVVLAGEGENRTLVPRSEYLPDPTIYVFRVGDTFPYRNNTTSVAAIASSGVTLEWTGARTNTVRFQEGGNVTLGQSDQTFVAHFPSGGTLQLTDNFADVRTDRQRIDRFHERVNGLWAVTIISGIAAFLLVGMAFLPSRY